MVGPARLLVLLLAGELNAAIGPPYELAGYPIKVTTTPTHY